MLYRTRANLSGKREVPAGSILRESDLSAKALAALLARGVLQPVSPPPLAALPGWQHRGKRLAEMGVEDASQVVEGDADEMARHCGVSPVLVRRWQEELVAWLTPPTDRTKG